MSVMVETVPYSTGVPGAISWARVRWARISAFCCASNPASVAGAVAPAIASGDIASGWRYSAQRYMPSSWSLSIWSGFITEQIPNMRGRFLSSSFPPATIDAIRIMSSLGMTP
jgi:hypothetical protein